MCAARGSRWVLRLLPLTLGQLPRTAWASPHLRLKQGAAPLVSYQVDRSVLGNLKAGLKKAPVAAEDQAERMPVQISSAHSQIAEILIGTPPQKMRCLIDSGSSDLWVPSKRCENCDNDHYFNADASSTFEPEMESGRPRQVKISYGSGEVVGYAVHDTLKFGSATLPNQAFIIVEDAELPPDREWDGICGLGWQGLAQVSPALFENLQEHGEQAVFSIFPAAGSQAFGGDKAAHLLVGDLPKGVYKEGSLAWVDAEDYNGGMIAASGGLSFWVVSGGLRINAPEPIPARFLVDTGTNQVLLVPTAHYDDFIRSLIPSEKFDEQCGNDPRAGVACDCSIMEDPNMKPLQITLGDQTFKLPLSKMFVKSPATFGGDMCVLTIQPNTMTGGAGLGGVLGSGLGGLLGALLGPRRLQTQPGQHPTPAEEIEGILGPLGLGGIVRPVGAEPSGHAAPQEEGGYVAPDGNEAPYEQAPSPGSVPYGTSGPGGRHDALGDLLGGLLGVRGSPPPSAAQGPPEQPPEERPSPQGAETGPAKTQPSTSGPGGRHDALGDLLGGLLGVGGSPPPSAAQGPPEQSPEERPSPQGAETGPAKTQPSMAGEEPWMIGGMFLENFVTVFDFDNKRMGMAEIDSDARRRLAESEPSVQERGALLV